MVPSEIELLRIKLLAIDLRLHEMTQEAQESQIDVTRLERAVDNCRLARALGDEDAAEEELAPRLQASRDRLHRRLRTIKTAKDSRWRTRVQLAVACARKIQERQDGRDSGDGS